MNNQITLYLDDLNWIAKVARDNPDLCDVYLDIIKRNQEKNLYLKNVNTGEVYFCNILGSVYFLYAKIQLKESQHIRYYNHTRGDIDQTGEYSLKRILSLEKNDILENFIVVEKTEIEQIQCVFSEAGYLGLKRQGLYLSCGYKNDEYYSHSSPWQDVLYDVYSSLDQKIKESFLIEELTNSVKGKHIYSFFKDGYKAVVQFRLNSGALISSNQKTYARFILTRKSKYVSVRIDVMKIKKDQCN